MLLIDINTGIIFNPSDAVSGTHYNLVFIGKEDKKKRVLVDRYTSTYKEKWNFNITEAPFAYVLRKLDTSLEEMVSLSRKKEIELKRKVFVYYLYTVNKYSYAYIAYILNRSTHGTMMAKVTYCENSFAGYDKKLRKMLLRIFDINGKLDIDKIVIEHIKKEEAENL